MEKIEVAHLDQNLPYMRCYLRLPRCNRSSYLYQLANGQLYSAVQPPGTAPESHCPREYVLSNPAPSLP